MILSALCPEQELNEFQTSNSNMNIFEQQQCEFQGRHIGPNETEKDAMLAVIGVSSLDELIGKTIPDGIRIKEDLDVPAAISEFPVHV